MSSNKRELTESEKENVKMCYKNKSIMAQDGYERYESTNFYLISKIDTLKQVVQLNEFDSEFTDLNPPEDEFSSNTLFYKANLNCLSTEAKEISLEDFKSNYNICNIEHEGRSTIRKVLNEI